MASLHLEITHNIDPFVAKLSGAEGVVGQELAEGVNRAATWGLAAAQARAAVRTGLMRGTIQLDRASASPAPMARYYPTARNAKTGFPYYMSIEFGRRGFMGKRGNMLWIPTINGGIWRKKVGPAPAQPFMRPSARIVRAILPGEMRAAVARIRARLGL